MGTKNTNIENTNTENLKESQQIQDPVMEGLQGLRSVSSNFSRGAQDEINLAIELRELLGENSESALATLNQFSGNAMNAPEAVDLGHVAPEDFGESKYDYDIKNEEDLYNLEDFRGRNQEGIYQGFNALAKIPVVFGESVLMIGNGLFAAVASAIDTNDENGNGTFADWIDNPWYKYNKELFTQIREQLPNYRTLEEQNNEWYENLFSTQGYQNVMAGFIESAGFSLSAMALGVATAPIWSSLGLSTLGTAIAASGVGAVSESLAEAVMNVEETVEEGKKAYHLEEYDQEIDRIDMDSSLTIEEKILKQSNILDAKKQKEAQAEQELYKAASTAGISDFLGNVIVTWGLDLLAFGKVFGSTAFDLARRTNKTLKNVDRATSMARTAENTIASGKNKGSWFKKASSKYDKNLQTDASKMKRDPKTGEYKEPTKLDALKETVKSGMYEGTQELFQAGVASGSTFYGLHADGSDTWLNSEFNQMKGDEESSIAWASVAHGLAESFLNPEAYQEFMGGFLMGAGGMLTLGKQNNSGPQTWLGKGKVLGMSGGLFGNIAEINRYKGLAQIMNKFNESSLGEYVHRANTFTEMSNGWGEVENKFEFKNYQDNDLFNIVNAYIKAGRLQDLKDMVNTLNVENLSDQDLESIAIFMESPNGGNSSLGYRDNEGKIDKEEVKKQVNKNIKAFNDVITSYENSITDVRNMLGKNSLNRDEEAALAWLHYKAYNSGNRIDSIVDSLRGDDIWNKLPNNVEINVGKGEDRVTYNLTKDQIVNSFYNGARPKTEEEYNKTKSVNDPEYKYSADYILSHAWDKIVGKVVEGIADDSIDTKKEEISNSLKDLEKLGKARTQFNLEYFKYLHSPEMLRSKRNAKQKAQEYKEKIKETIKNKKEEKEKTTELKKTTVSNLLKQYNQIKEDDKKLEFIRSIMSSKEAAKGVALKKLIEAQKNLIDAIQADTILTDESKAIIIPKISTWAERFNASEEFLDNVKNLQEDSDIEEIKKEWIPNIKQAAENILNNNKALEEAQKNIDSTKREEKKEEDDKDDNSEEEDKKQTVWDIISKLDSTDPGAYNNIVEAMSKIKNMLNNEHGIKQFSMHEYSHDEGTTKVYNIGYPIYKDSEGDHYIQLKTDSDAINPSKDSELFFPIRLDSGKVIYYSTPTTLAEFKSEVLSEEIEDRILSHVLGTSFNTDFVEPYLWMFSSKENAKTFKSDFFKAVNDFFDTVKKATNSTSKVTSIPEANNTDISGIIQKHIKAFKNDKRTTKTYDSFKADIITEVKKQDNSISEEDIEKSIKDALDKEDLLFENRTISPSLVYPETTSDLDNMDSSDSLPDKDDYNAETNTSSGETLNYWKSSISEIPIHPKKGEMIPYHLTKGGYNSLKNNPKLLKLHAVIWQICKDEGMFEALRGNKTPTKGKITFTILAEAQKKLKEPVQITVDGEDITLDTVVEEPVIFYKNDKGQILGVLAFDDDINNTKVKQQKGLKEFKETVKEEYQAADKDSDFDSQYTTAINTVNIGKMLFGNDEKAVINISEDASNSISVYTQESNNKHSIFIDGEQKDIKESEILFFKGIKRGQAFLIIPCSGDYKYRAVPLKSKTLEQVLKPDSKVGEYFKDLIEDIKSYITDNKPVDKVLIEHVNVMCDLFNIKYKHTVNKSKSGDSIYLTFIDKNDSTKEPHMIKIDNTTTYDSFIIQSKLANLSDVQGRVVLHRKNNEISIKGKDYDYNKLISEIYYTNLIEESGKTVAETVGNWVTLVPLEKEGTGFKVAQKTDLTPTEKKATSTSVANSAEDNIEKPSVNPISSQVSTKDDSSEINIEAVNKKFKSRRKRSNLTQDIIDKLSDSIKNQLKKVETWDDKTTDTVFKEIQEALNPTIKEIPKTDNKSKIQDIIKRHSRIGQFERDSKSYIINGNYYNRVHAVKGSNWNAPGNSTPNSNRVNAGNDVDLIGREILSNNSRGFYTYTEDFMMSKLSDDARDKAAEQFKSFKEKHSDEEFYTEGLIVYGEVDGVPIAGELDCISVNKETKKVTIYDFKTSQYPFTGTYFTDKGSKQTASTKQDYTRQLALYAKVLKQNYDLEVTKLVLLGTQLTYMDDNVSNKVIDVSEITEVDLKDEINEANNYLAERLKEFRDATKYRESKPSPYEKMNRQREMEWLAATLPQFSDEQRLHFTDKIGTMNVTAWGAFKRGLIFITDTAAKGTIYHEAFHAVTDCLLTPQEYQDLLQEGRKMYPDPNLSDLDIEEKLAEDFRVFVELMEMAEEDMTPKQLEDYKRILGAVKNLKGEHGEGLTRLEAFYWNIHRGKFANRTLNETLNSGKKDALIEYEKEINAIKQKAIEDGTFMEAPNGKPTNLTEQQWLQVRTKAFKEWFGDWEKGLSIEQNSNSFYRGQYDEPYIDSNGNLVLYGRKDPLYEKAGYKDKGVSVTRDLKSAIEYGEGQLETRTNLVMYNSMDESEQNAVMDNGYYLIQFKDSISNKEIKEAGESKIIGDIVIPEGSYVIEHYVYGELVETIGKIDSSNDVSKVVDENGEPLVVYHGTRTSKHILKEGFSKDMSGKGNRGANNKQFYFTNSIENAEYTGINKQHIEPFIDVVTSVYDLFGTTEIPSTKDIYELIREKEKEIKELKEKRDYYPEDSIIKKIINKIIVFFNKNYKTREDIINEYKHTIDFLNNQIEDLLHKVDVAYKYKLGINFLKGDRTKATVNLLHFIKEEINKDSKFRKSAANRIINILYNTENLEYSPDVLAVFLNIRKPLESDFKMNPTDENPLKAGRFSSSYIEYSKKETALLDTLKSKEFDGAISKNKFDILFGDVYITKNPNQIKSATDNIGLFDSESDDIRFREASYNRRSSKQATVRLNKLSGNKFNVNPDTMKGVILTDTQGHSIFNAMGRTFILCNVNGTVIPFYQSSKGTSGKIKGNWYPFFGYTGNWLIKGGVDKNGKMSYSAGIDRITELLNKDFVIPTDFNNKGVSTSTGINVKDLGLNMYTVFDRFGKDMANMAISDPNALEFYDRDLGELTNANALFVKEVTGIQTQGIKQSHNSYSFIQPFIDSTNDKYDTSKETFNYKDYHQEIQDYYEQKWAYVNLTQEQKQVLENMGINPKMYDSLSLEEKEVLHHCRM